MLIQNINLKNKTGKGFIILGIALIIVAIILDLLLKPIIERATTYQAQVTASRIMNEVIYSEVSGYGYDDLVIVSKNENGAVTSIESNMVNINQLKARTTDAINERMMSIEKSELRLPLGTILGISFLYGRGPSLSINLTPKGYTSINLVSRFTSAGVNQTLHQIEIIVKTEISAIILGYTSPATVETEFIIAQTVIVGEVPESYTHIIL